MNRVQVEVEFRAAESNETCQAIIPAGWIAIPFKNGVQCGSDIWGETRADVVAEAMLRYPKAKVVSS